jgi:NodT family efflux transporter outer membrane factor (OMF) lipoprotein
LVNNVVAAAIGEASLRDQIRAVEAIIAAEQRSRTIVARQVALGAAMAIDLANADQALAQAEGTLPPLLKQLDQTRDLLRSLLGQLPDQEVEAVTDLDQIHPPPDIPLSLPSHIVDQRPDVRAAQQLLRAANAQVGVAIAARLPQFTLTGAAGGAATQIDQIFGPGGPFWSVIGDIAQPIFDGNTLLHRERAADQGLLFAAAQYRTTLIAAYQNVADSLNALQSDQKALIAAARTERAAHTALDVTRKQNKLGYTDFLTLNAAEIAEQQAMIAVYQASGQKLADIAALYQSLGGGWWHRPAEGDNTEKDVLFDH